METESNATGQPFDDFRSDATNEVNKLIVGNPTNKDKFCEHIKKIIAEAEKYGQYLRAEWQKAKKAGITQCDENKDREKWFWWTACANDWSWGECVYFSDVFENGEYVSFYIQGQPRPDPLGYLHSMTWGAVGQKYDGLQLLDYQYILLAIIHDAQSWQAGREKIYFNAHQTNTLADRLCKAVCHNSIDQQTVKTALLAVKADLKSKEPCYKKLHVLLGIVVLVISVLGFFGIRQYTDFFNRKPSPAPTIQLNTSPIIKPLIDPNIADVNKPIRTN